MTTRSPATATVTWPGANARRPARQHLHPDAAATASSIASPGAAVAAVLGAHAQVLSAAELSVGLRGNGLTRTDVRTALWTDRTLVKTFGPRSICCPRRTCPCGPVPCPPCRREATPSPRTPG